MAVALARNLMIIVLYSPQLLYRLHV